MEGGRGLQGVKKAVKVTNIGLENYVKEFRELLRTASRSVDIAFIEPIRETSTEAKKQKKKEKAISWKEKPLHDQFLRQTKEAGSQDKWQ